MADAKRLELINEFRLNEAQAPYLPQLHLLMMVFPALLHEVSSAFFDVAQSRAQNERDGSLDNMPGIHRVPATPELSSMWDTMTRLSVLFINAQHAGSATDTQGRMWKEALKEYERICRRIVELGRTQDNEGLSGFDRLLKLHFPIPFSADAAHEEPAHRKAKPARPKRKRKGTTEENGL